MPKNAKSKETEEEKGLQVLAGAADLKGDYCNVAAIHHAQTEFVFDFFFQLGNQGQLVSRIITNPQHAKAIMSALSENIKKYESRFGTIKPLERSERKPAQKSQRQR